MQVGRLAENGERSGCGLRIAALVLATLAAAPATASTLSFSGTLGFLNLTSRTLGEVGFRRFTGGASGTGVAIVNGSGGGLHLSTIALPSAFGPATVSLPVTASPTFQSVRFTSFGNQAATFGPGLSGGPPGGGPMALTGLMRICVIFAGCQAAVNVPLSPTGATGFGIGGTSTPIPPAGSIAVTLQHNPWMIGEPIVTIHDPATSTTTPVLPAVGFAHDAASVTSSTAVGSGTLQLVTVSKAFTSLTSAFPELAVTSVLTIHVPEPGTLLLLGAAALAVARGRRKARAGQSPTPSRR